MLKNIWNKLGLEKKNLAKDSFWAVFGNGLGDGLLLLAGIIIARLLGKDLYGEYGVVKTTMVYIASFASFGLGTTSTKYVAQFISKHKDEVSSVIKSIYVITLFFSGILAILLLIFAPTLATLLHENSLVLPFRFLALVIVFRAIITSAAGIIAGFLDFKKLAINNCISGITMLVLCIPLTYFFGLIGSLSTLLVSQGLNAVLHSISINNLLKSSHSRTSKTSYVKELLSFSFPIAIRDSSLALCGWFGISILTKYSSLGEVGIYSATAQWNAIITVIPGLLGNVVLSYLSKDSDDLKKSHDFIKKMLAIYACCTILPFIVVFCFTPLIVSFYGPTFTGMGIVMRLFIFATIPFCCTQVFQSEFTALGKNWFLLITRILKDALQIILGYLLITHHNGFEGAYWYSVANLSASVFYFVMMFVSYEVEYRRKLSTYEH